MPFFKKEHDVAKGHVLAKQKTWDKVLLKCIPRLFLQPKVSLEETSGEELSCDLVSLTKVNSEKSVLCPRRLSCPLATVNCDEDPDLEVWKWDLKFWSKELIWKVWRIPWVESDFLDGETCSRKSSSAGDTAEGGVVSSPENENECWESPTSNPKWGFSKVDLNGELIPDLNLLGEGNCFSVEKSGCPAKVGFSEIKLRLWLVR